MKTTTLIAIALLSLGSCQDDAPTPPQGIAYDMAGTFNVIYSPSNAPMKFVTLEVQPLSPNRALLVYKPYGANQSLWLIPNDTVDFGPNSTATIGPDTFQVNNSLVIHNAVGTYTDNTIVFAQHRNQVNLYTYTSRIEAYR